MMQRLVERCDDTHPGASGGKQTAGTMGDKTQPHGRGAKERRSEVAAGGACLLTAPRAPPLKENTFFIISHCFLESSDV